MGKESSPEWVVAYIRENKRLADDVNDIVSIHADDALLLHLLRLTVEVYMAATGERMHPASWFAWLSVLNTFRGCS